MTHQLTWTIYDEEADERGEDCEFDVELTVSATPGERQTYWDPGCDPECEVIDVRLDGKQWDGDWSVIDTDAVLEELGQQADDDAGEAAHEARKDRQRYGY